MRSIEGSYDEIILSQVQHTARVTIDEEGMESAYTRLMVDIAAMPPDEEMSFTVGRPVLFAITGNDGLPLFVGYGEQTGIKFH